MRLATEIIRDQDEKVHAKVVKGQVRHGPFYLTFDLSDNFFLSPLFLTFGLRGLGPF